MDNRCCFDIEPQCTGQHFNQHGKLRRLTGHIWSHLCGAIVEIIKTKSIDHCHCMWNHSGIKQLFEHKAPSIPKFYHPHIELVSCHFGHHFWTHRVMPKTPKNQSHMKIHSFSKHRYWKTNTNNKTVKRCHKHRYQVYQSLKMATQTPHNLYPPEKTIFKP